MTADRICVTVGAQEALLAVLMVVVDRGDEVLVPDPGFPAYPSLVRMAGGEPKSYPLRARARLPAEGGRRPAPRSGSRTKAVDPQQSEQPDGRRLRGSRIEEAGRRAAGRVRPGDFGRSLSRDRVRRGRRLRSRGFSGRCAVIDSFSKSYCMTGWRIGWCAVPAELVAPLGELPSAGGHLRPGDLAARGHPRLAGAADADRARNVAELRARRDLAARCLRRHSRTSASSCPKGRSISFVDVAAKRARLGGFARHRLEAPGRGQGRHDSRASLSEAGERAGCGCRSPRSPKRIEEGIRRIGRRLAG